MRVAVPSVREVCSDDTDIPRMNVDVQVSNALVYSIEVPDATSDCFVDEEAYSACVVVVPRTCKDVMFVPLGLCCPKFLTGCAPSFVDGQDVPFRVLEFCK